MQCVPHLVRKTVEDATKDEPLDLRPERNDSRLVLEPDLASAAIPTVDPLMGSRTSNGVAVLIFLSADAASPLADESAHALGALPRWASMTASTPTVAHILSPAVSTVLDRRSILAMFRMSPDRIYPAVFTTPAGTHVAVAPTSSRLPGSPTRPTDVRSALLAPKPTSTGCVWG